MRTRSHRHPLTAPATGSVTVELALVLPLLLTLVLGTLEVARLLYVVNTVQDVTRTAARMAAVTDFSDPTAIAALKQRALLNSDANGTLPLVPEIGAAQLRIEYLGQDAAGDPVTLTQMPACPQQNVVNCARNPQGDSCIYYVRASICKSAGGACEALPYQLMTGYPDALKAMAIRIPSAATLVKAERLGYRPGTNNCL
jgi:hypothetical protein